MLINWDFRKLKRGLRSGWEILKVAVPMKCVTWHVYCSKLKSRHPLLKSSRHVVGVTCCFQPLTIAHMPPWHSMSFDVDMTTAVVRKMVTVAARNAIGQKRLENYSGGCDWLGEQTNNGAFINRAYRIWSNLESACLKHLSHGSPSLKCSLSKLPNFV